jgi:hypothetical protein
MLPGVPALGSVVMSSSVRVARRGAAVLLFLLTVLTGRWQTGIL